MATGALRTVALAPATLQLRPLLGDDLLRHGALRALARPEHMPHVIASADGLLGKTVGEHLLSVHPLAHRAVEPNV
eukprot:2475104-Pyramimonas_sp.AAC.1